MLKIERGYKNEAIFELQKKEAFFNSLFIQALLIAFFFHASFFMLFSIVSFKFETKTLAFVFVEADQLETDALVYTELVSGRKAHRSFPFVHYPKQDSFLLPPCSLGDAFENEESEEIDVLDNPFFCLEKDLQHEYFFLEQKEKKKGVAACMRNGLHVDFIENALLTLLEGLENVHALYEIKVENKTGQIFWMEPKIALEEKLDARIRKALKEIRFEKQNTGFLESGEIEILL
ncbi:MAG TPA: hypothetical protein PLC42_07805 [Parachlamydiaceae bacterium]|nr:hypothetical protein [Parachlamydiaceae bacterium]